MLTFLKINQILWIDPSTFLVALVPLLLARIPSVRTEQGRSSFKKEFAEGLRFIKNRKGLVPLITLATALNFLITPLDTLLPYFIKFNHFGGASELALVIACLQGGMLAGGVLMTATKGFKKKMVAAMLFIYVVNLGYGLVALTLAGAFLLMAIGALIMGFCIAPVNVSIQTIVQTVVPMDMQGRVNSVMGAGAMAASPAG